MSGVTYYGGRRSGKTTALLEWAAASPSSRVLVTATAVERDRLLGELAELLDVADWEVVDSVVSAGTLSELRGKHREIAVDNAYWVLGVLLGVTPDRMTVDSAFVERLPLAPAGEEKQ